MKRKDPDRRLLLDELLDERTVVTNIMSKATDLGGSADAVTPENVLFASQVTGAEAASQLLKSGVTLEDCATLRKFYDHVGEYIASQMSTGGRFDGATFAGVDHGPVERDVLATPQITSGIRHEPAFDSDPVGLISTAGGFIDGSWADVGTWRTSRRSDGTWILNHYPTEGVVALHFFGRNFSGFVEIFQQDIASSRVVEKGRYLAVEIADVQGRAIIAVGPKKRLRSIFKQVGHSV